MIGSSVLDVLVTRAAVELARVASARPALEKRCGRAVEILATHAEEPRACVIRARSKAGELVGYLVRGSHGAVYRVEARGSWRCSCPDHHGRHRRRDSSRACKHGLACWALFRAASGASAPEVERVAAEVSARAADELAARRSTRRAA